jgi:L-threonylcarbamoyladenylate synthase
VIKKSSPDVIKEAAKLLKDGQLVAFPTETVYGLGANALSDEAVKKIYATKGRPANNPLIIHTYSGEKAASWANLSDSKIAERFNKAASLWPGPLSLVVPSAQEISKAASAGQNTIALRVPKHDVALAILKECDLPIAAPSANQSFYVSPTMAEHVEKSIGEKIPLIIDGGSCEIGLESTVLDLTSSKPTILRPGAISAEQLSHVLKEDVVTNKISIEELNSGVLSPGLLAKHYSPHTKLRWLRSVKELPNLRKVGIIRFSPESEIRGLIPEIVVTLSQTGDLNEIASKLYDAIRELDDLNLDLILIDSCSEDGLGRAIMDRISRAVHKEK